VPTRLSTGAYFGNLCAIDACPPKVREPRVVAMFELREAHREREIRSRIAVDGLMRCDTGRIRQLLSNLLANARVHGRADKPVSVRAWLDGEHAVIEVHNEGDPGAANRLGLVYQPFWRRTASREGLGLGRCICSQIGRTHADSLVGSSSLAQGTCFLARRPVVGQTRRRPAAGGSTTISHPFNCPCREPP